jgi:endonuclease III-like uncharacterized protein
MTESSPSGAPQDDPWEDLVLAILSVNNYSIEKVYAKLQQLRRQGLFNPNNLCRWSHDEIAERLKAAGYDRGSFMTNLFSGRLAALGRHAEQVGVERFTRALSSKTPKGVEEALHSVSGVGPKVIENYCLLRGIGR